MADINRLETWIKYKNGLCDDCMASCCTMPVEVKLPDLVRIGVIDEFELEEPIKGIAKRLEKQRVIQHFNFKNSLFTLAQRGQWRLPVPGRANAALHHLRAPSQHVPQPSQGRSQAQFLRLYPR
ncbi:Uncharacterised protein [Chromobacterium violaceum]|nr:Uncharacterised protein [Chromobacterium violaceum]